MPEPSNPGTHGNYLLLEYAPCKNAISDGLIGAESTFINTYPDYGVGIGISFTTHSYPGPSNTTALIDVYIIY